MGKCLSEQSFLDLRSGSASAEKLTRWKRHLRECDSCAAYFILLQTGLNDFPQEKTAGLSINSGDYKSLIDGRLEPNVRIGDFVVEKRLGSGGMGTVYQARQLSLNREVALKVMSAGILTTTEAIERFHREARAAAKLHHTNIVAIYAEGQEEQTCYYAMELVEGQTLERIIKDLQVSRNDTDKKVLPYDCHVSYAGNSLQSDESSFSKSKSSLGHTESSRQYFDSVATMIADVADALEYAHRKGIIHRDVKPSNLILGNNDCIKLMDFGLARMLDEHSVTVTGAFMGTVNYMSPEQVGGIKHKTDHRTDIYSLGVTLYELLTLTKPLTGETHEQVITQILTKEAIRPRKIDKQVPIDLETICCKAMEKQPEQRYQSAGQMAEDLRRYVNRYVISIKKAGPVERVIKLIQRHKVLSCLTTGIAAMTITAVFAGWKYFTYQWVQKTALPKVEHLVDDGLYTEAFPIAKKALFFAPHDSRLVSLLSEFTKLVSINTNPSGAEVYVKRYNLPDDKWTKLGKSPINKIRMTQGLYRWQIVKPEYAYLEFRCPVDETMIFTLEKNDVTPPDMVRVEGGSYTLGLNGMSMFKIEMPDYYIDRYEVTNKQFQEFVDSGGYENEKYWKQPFIKEDKIILWQEVIKEFIDSTNNPGPAVWINGHYPEGMENYPVSGISWYEAAAYAEFSGKELPTIYHWSNAGITLGTYEGTILQFSNFDSNSVAPVSQYPSLGDFGTYDMAGNVREWCWNEAEDGKRYNLGGSWNDQIYTFSSAIKFDPFDRSVDNGFRCMKELPDNTIPVKAYEPVISQIRDYSKETPVSEEEFLIYKNTLYSYDKSDLNPIIIAKDDTQAFYIHETICIDAAYGNERMNLHLYLPKNTQPPYQVVFYFPGNSAIFLREFAGRGLPPFLLRNGRAVIYPIYKGTYERNTGLTTNRPDISETYRDHVIWWAKDIGKAIDYLETRDDIQHDKIGYYGLSWGAALGAIFPAVEERIKVCILYGGAFYYEHSRPEADQINFAPRINIPMLMLNGEYESTLHIEESQKPMFNLFGTPDEHKKHVLIKGGHLPKEQVSQETLTWLDRYLGLVEINND